MGSFSPERISFYRTLFSGKSFPTVYGPPPKGKPDREQYRIMMANREQVRDGEQGTGSAGEGVRSAAVWSRILRSKAPDPHSRRVISETAHRPRLGGGRPLPAKSNSPHACYMSRAPVPTWIRFRIRLHAAGC